MISSNFNEICFIGYESFSVSSNVFHMSLVTVLATVSHFLANTLQLFSASSVSFPTLS